MIEANKCVSHPNAARNSFLNSIARWRAWEPWESLEYVHSYYSAKASAYLSLLYFTIRFQAILYYQNVDFDFDGILSAGKCYRIVAVCFCNWLTAEENDQFFMETLQDLPRVTEWDKVEVSGNQL